MEVFSTPIYVRQYKISAHASTFFSEGRAGGLTALSKMPSCNIQVLGAHRRNLAGFSNTASLPHTGYIYHSEFVQKLPPDLRIRAARLLANKVALAARVDSFHRSQVSTGEVGGQLVLSFLALNHYG